MYHAPATHSQTTVTPAPPTSHHFDQLPIIDISGLYSPDLSVRLHTAEALGKAAREVGFFYIKGHAVSKLMRSHLIEQTRDFFDLPLTEKMRYYIGNSGNLAHRGYVPEGEEVFATGKHDRKEAFDLGFEHSVDDPDVIAGTPMHGLNIWPEQEGFEAAIRTYYQAVFALGQTLLHGFALALGLAEEAFNGFIQNPTSQLRLIHYPFDASASDSPGIGAHTDYECFTILLPTAPGLEVVNGEGKWIDAPPMEDAFIVNIGDLMEIWSGGTFVATAHRVRKVSTERYSFPLFFGCDYHTHVEPLPAFATAETIQKYPALNAGEHLFAQTAQSFGYLKVRLNNGSLKLGHQARPLNSFGPSEHKV
ncbi:isopenicillin N synthase family dioxygenase [Aquirhabdus sp.]|uniref:isopenicillin N synthase family dioxygenase n=1 Tax=Aquirhabdus sp. TaxID=2824160 RepID=UPI00396CFB21